MNFMELNKTFIDGLWSKEINVTDFVSRNITPYTGDASFLQGPTERTKRIWEICLKALEEGKQQRCPLLGQYHSIHHHFTSSRLHRQGK